MLLHQGRLDHVGREGEVVVVSWCGRGAGRRPGRRPGPSQACPQPGEQCQRRADQGR
jgi:hypothetical protein